METNTNTNSNEEEVTPFEKIIGLNKLGCLFLSSDKYDKAQSILQKTMDFYLEQKANKKIPNFFYSNLYCNLAKAYSCKKDFDMAEKYYLECIINHPYHKILISQSDYLTEQFLININELLNIRVLDKHEILNKFDIVMKYFSTGSNNDLKDNFKEKIIKKFKPNNLNSLSSFSDSLVNLAVIFQYKFKETSTAFDMYYLALLLDQDNNVANIDFNNFLRETNLKDKSDEYITKRIEFGYLLESKCDDFQLESIKANKEILKEQNEDELYFLCMKWGNKYDSEYVNKLYRGILRNTSKKFKFFCITDNQDGLAEGITSLPLDMTFKGWMRKSVLFADTYLNQITEKNNQLICFIDLDMIICGNLDYLWQYKGNFCLMKTDDIQCESSINGYNSSIILWRRNFGTEIYKYMNKYYKWINNQVIRFDHYLEFLVKNSDYVQEVFEGKVLDYNTYCKNKTEISESCSIIAFPRNPKPHECNEKWISQHWI